MSTTSLPLRLPTRRLPITLLLSVASIRFNLRELLLFMLVCAAFSGWGHEIYQKRRSLFQKRQPFHSTYVAEYFANGLLEDVVAARDALGEEGVAWRFASTIDRKGLSAGLEGKGQIRLFWDCGLDLPWKKAFKFREALTRRIAGRIKQGEPGDFVSLVENLGEKLETLGATTDNLPPQVDGNYLGRSTIGIIGFYEDEIRYRCGDVRGELRICLVESGQKPIRLMATLNEWRPR